MCFRPPSVDAMVKTCPKCNANCQPGDTACPSCGAPLPAGGPSAAPGAPGAPGAPMAPGAPKTPGTPQ